MRVYHMMREEHGLETIRNRRLKVSQLKELNDPFELLGVELSDEDLRRAIVQMKRDMSENRGIHCFSKRWSNPVLWSHYADKHRGICLGFDIPDELLLNVNYARKRLSTDALLQDIRNDREEFMKTILATKFSHWKYEDEVRVFVDINDRDNRTGHYYSEFSDQLVLRQIIVGSESSASRSQVDAALGELKGCVETFQARPAFKSFKVVRNKKQSLWH